MSFSLEGVALTPPSRFATSRFDSYCAASPEQKRALEAARAFSERAKQPPSLSNRLRRWLPGVAPPEPPRGLYLVGPVGTGKTHLMAAAYHNLTPEVNCAFVHSSQLFRAARHPSRLARRLAQPGAEGSKIRVLMIDEVELDDAANEARLAQFLRVLIDEGVALMATSNARPDAFIAQRLSDSNRHRRFLNDALAGQCEVAVVAGADHRRDMAQQHRGRIFVGPPDEAEAALRRAFTQDDDTSRWLRFEEMRRASTEIAHEQLIAQLLQTERLYVAGVQLRDTDDALRLLRIVDALYTADDAPSLYFSADSPPEDWFTAEEGGVSGGIATKFTRTVSRLRELCALQRVASPMSASSR